MYDISGDCASNDCALANGMLRDIIRRMKSTLFDPDSTLVRECCAVINAPGRQRKRFPETCVEVMESEEAARAAADAANKHFAAVVLGPARSSEGIRVFHLVRWLD